MTPEQLIELAKEAMTRAYTPYSGFKVGAALLCADGKAVSEGKREFAALAVCGGKDGIITGICPPCGVCRQVLREFCKDDFPVYLVLPEGKYETWTLAQLLPCSFSL